MRPTCACERSLLVLFFGVKYKLRPKFRTLGRAAVDNPNVRYEKLTREGVDDGWAWDDDLRSSAHAGNRRGAAQGDHAQQFA